MNSKNLVVQEWNQIKDGPLTLTEDEITRCKKIIFSKLTMKI